VGATALLTATAKATAIYYDVPRRKLSCARVEADEICSFTGAKAVIATNKSQADIWPYIAQIDGYHQGDRLPGRCQAA
jgi:hypothetical protein